MLGSGSARWRYNVGRDTSRGQRTCNPHDPEQRSTSWRPPPRAGDLLKNPDYAGTLRKLVEAEQQAKAKGASRSAAIKAAFDRFYKGDIAQEFDRFFRENGGVMRASDLAAYEPRWSEPLHTTYRGYDVYSNPSTSRGGFEVLMQASLVEGFDLRSFGPQSAKAPDREIEAIRSQAASTVRRGSKFTRSNDGRLRRITAIPLPAPADPSRRPHSRGLSPLITAGKHPADDADDPSAGGGCKAFPRPKHARSTRQAFRSSSIRNALGVTRPVPGTPSSKTSSTGYTGRLTTTECPRFVSSNLALSGEPT